MNLTVNRSRLVWFGLVAAVLLSSSVAGAQNCTSGLVYFTFGGHHYWRCGNQVNWTTARDRCAAFSPVGGSPYYLARPETVAELNALDSNRRGAIPVDTWIGVDDIVTENTWLWTNGAPAIWNSSPVTSSTGTPPWNGGEPNSSSEDCVEIQNQGLFNYTGRWNDENCTDTSDFFCEGVLPAGYICIDGSACQQSCTLSALGDSVYMYCGTTRTWAQAQTHCNQSGGDLVRVDSADEQYHLTRAGGLVGSQGSSVWHGGNDRGAEGTWLWSNNNDHFWTGTSGGTPIGGFYTQWAQGEPNNSGNEDCATFWNAGGADWRWNDANCGNNLPFVCELPNVCGDGFRSSTETCDDGNLISGDGCSAACTTESVLCGNRRIQGSETCDDGNTISNDGCSSTCQTERGWVCPTVPIYNTTGQPACFRACTTTTFFSRFPMTPAQLLAENGAQTASGSQTVASGVEYMGCPDMQNAYDAQLRCRAFGAGWGLARINSLFENTLIGMLVGGTFWIGLTDEHQEGQRRWRDGVALGTPTFWNTGEPNGVAGNYEDCVTSNASGAWYDISCRTSTVGYVCEGPAFCGNGAVAGNEECDDANTVDTDSCLNNCTVRFGHACLLPGGTGDADPPGLTCARGASCCYANAQAVVSSVRVVGGELEWTTAGEAGTLGFYVSVQQRGEWLDLHEGILPALPDAA
ncbi:MAG: DUF4215 domain-containing protein, partial [Myxococcales bacterium]|nr:DUF4215 domain-containing protein [Myxococcales bacterium]